LLPVGYRNVIIKLNIIIEIKASNKNYKVNESAVCFLYNISFCVIFIVEVSTVLIKVYTVFFGKKWVALKRCAVVSRTVTFPDRRFPDKTIPGQTFPGQYVFEAPFYSRWRSASTV